MVKALFGGIIMKKLLLSILLATALVNTPNANASIWSKIGGCIFASIAGYTIYKISQNYIENKIINETVESLSLALTPNSTISRLPAKEEEKAFRKKAWLINLRKRVIAQINTKIQDNNLSYNHRIALSNSLQTISAACHAIDNLRTTNPYEQEYLEASRLDQIIENKLINSIILRFKPNNECTQAELLQKKEIDKRRTLIVSRLKHKFSNNFFNFGIASIIEGLGNIFASGLA